MDDRPLLTVLLVVAAAVVPYVTVLGGGYVVDDVRLVRDNAALADPAVLGRAFTDPTTASSGQDGADWHGTYRPLRTLSFALDHAIGGGATWPFHVHNLLWHALASLGVLAFLRRLLGGSDAPLFGAVLFAVHPAQVESVAWISSRGDVMAGALTLAAVLLAIRPGRRGPLLALPVLAVALLAKESAVVAPLLVALVLVRGLPEGWRGSVLRRAVPLAALVVVYVVVRGAILSGAGDPGVGHRAGWWGGAWTGAVLTMARGAAHVAQVLLLPGNLFLDYHVPQPGPGEIPLDAVLLLVAVLALMALAVRGWVRGGIIGTGFLWMLVALAPVSNLVVSVSIPTAERFLYLPMAGFALLVVAALRRLVRRSAFETVATGAAALGIILLACMAMHRAGDWREEATLWAATFRGTTTSHRAPEYFAGLHLAAARAGLADAEERVAVVAALDEADRLAARALETARRHGGYGPDAPWTGGPALAAEIALARAELEGGAAWLDALERAEEAAEIAGDRSTRGHVVLGRVAFELGLLERAAGALAAARSSSPHDPTHVRNLSVVLNRLALTEMRSGRFGSLPRATRFLVASIAVDPDPRTNQDAHRLREALGQDLQRSLEAAEAAARSRGADPGPVLARILASFGRFDEAAAVLDRLERKGGTGPGLEVERAVLVHQLRGDRAGLEKAVEITARLFRSGSLPPGRHLDAARARVDLAALEDREGRPAEARAAAQDALIVLRAGPRETGAPGAAIEGDAHRLLARALRGQGRGTEADAKDREAAAAYERARSDPGLPAWGRALVLRREGEVREGLVDRDGALEVLRRALAEAPQAPDALWLRARIARLEAGTPTERDR